MIWISWKFRVNGNLICENVSLKTCVPLSLKINIYLMINSIRIDIFISSEKYIPYFYNNENLGTFRNVILILKNATGKRWIQAALSQVETANDYASPCTSSVYLYSAYPATVFTTIDPLQLCTILKPTFTRGQN